MTPHFLAYLASDIFTKVISKFSSSPSIFSNLADTCSLSSWSNSSETLGKKCYIVNYISWFDGYLSYRKKLSKIRSRREVYLTFSCWLLQFHFWFRKRLEKSTRPGYFHVDVDHHRTTLGHVYDNIPIKNMNFKLKDPEKNLNTRAFIKDKNFLNGRKRCIWILPT